jgi:hypothetical protein
VEYYTVTGGLATGLLFGLVSGFIVTRSLTSFRRKMATLEASSDAFKKLSSSKMARLTTWVFLGSDAKKGSWEDVLNKKVGLPVRPLGIVLVVLSAVLIFLVVQFGKGPIMTAVLRDGMEKANGATVDLENSEFDFKENKLAITGLAIADASNLDLDLLRAAKLEADIGTASLLSKRLLLERVVIDTAQHGAKRATPAYRIGPPPPVSDTPAPKPGDGESKTLDDYLKEAKAWKERLAKLREWMEKLSGPESEEGKAGPPSPKDGEAFEDWLRRQVEVAGYDGVRAEHLITAAPTFTIGELVINGLTVPQLPGESLEVRGKNLTTHPWLIDAEKTISVTSASDVLGAAIQIGGTGATNTGNGFRFHYRGLPTDQVASGIQFGGQQTLSGGTLDVSAAGSWRNIGGIEIDLPLQVRLNNVNVALPGGAGNQAIESLDIPIGLEGPLDNPRIKVESKAFAEVVKQAAMAKGREILKDKVGSEIEKTLGDKVKLPGGAKGLLNNFLGGGKK